MLDLKTEDSRQEATMHLAMKGAQIARRIKSAELHDIFDAIYLLVTRNEVFWGEDRNAKNVQDLLEKPNEV